MPYVDFSRVRQQVSIEQVVAWLGLDLVEKNKQLRGPCPINDGGHRALVITPAENCWYCWAPECRSGGGTIELVAKIRGLEFRDAAIAIQKHFLPSGRSTPADTPLKPLEDLDHEHPLVKEYGWSVAEAKAFGVGYCKRGIMAGRVAVPLRDDQGELVGYTGINLALSPPIKMPSKLRILR